MANQAWDRQIINTRERPVSADINAAQSQADRSLRDLLASFFTTRASTSSELAGTPPTGFVGDGLKVRPPAVPSLAVQVAPGLGFMYAPADVPAAVSGVVGVDDLSVFKPLPLVASTAINGIPAGPGVGFDRYDIVEVRINRAAANPLSRDTLDTGSGLFVSGLLNKTLGFTLDGSVGVVTSPASSTAAISYKVGVVAATGAAVEPSLTAGYTKLATIFSNNGNMTAGVTRANILDKRRMLGPYGMAPFYGSFSIPTGAASPPTALSFTGPPGVECVVLKFAPPANNIFDVFLLGPNQGGAMSVDVVAAYAANTLYTCQATGIAAVASTLNSPQTALLADATLSANPILFPVGHPYFSAQFAAHRQASGTTDATVPDPLIVAFRGFIKV